MNIVSASAGNIILKFLGDNWSSLLLIVVGTFALVVYILQERKKVTDAASLIVLQIDELKDRIIEIQSFIVNGQLNETAFYESQPLFIDDYWNHYKHFFVRLMDPMSYRIINSLYDCAIEIKEQQQLMKNLQINFFYTTQQVLANLETNYILLGLNNSREHPVDIQQAERGLLQTMPQNLEPAQKTAIENMLRQIADKNGNIDFISFWDNYNQIRSNIKTIIDQKGLTIYTPLQIRLSLEKALNKCAFLEVTGCAGYMKLKEVSRRKF